MKIGPETEREFAATDIMKRRNILVVHSSSGGNASSSPPHTQWRRFHCYHDSSLYLSKLTLHLEEIMGLLLLLLLLTFVGQPLSHKNVVNAKREMKQAHKVSQLTQSSFQGI